MKASLGKRRRSGNSAPAKRTSFPDVIQSTLDNALHPYTRQLGIKQAFNLYRYKNPQGQQAESPHSIAQLAPLLDALLTVSNSAKIKYKALKQSFTFLLQTWGVSLLQEHWQDLAEGLLAGRCADSVGMLLKHWRRVSKSASSWEKVSASWMKLMQQLWKKTTSDTPMTAAQED